MDVVGPPGVGKSHLAGALGVAAVKAGISVYRATLAELTDALLKAEKEWRLTEKLRFYTRVSLLIVCAIGCLPVTGGGNLFFQLVNARYEKGSVILTSNRGFAEWGDIFGDPAVATAPITPPPPGKIRRAGKGDQNRRMIWFVTSTTVVFDPYVACSAPLPRQPGVFAATAASS